MGIMKPYYYQLAFLYEQKGQDANAKERLSVFLLCERLLIQSFQWSPIPPKCAAGLK
jgi:hypothetical protein